MKYKFALLVLMLPLFTIGQNLNKDSLAGGVIKDLIDSWNLGINDDVTQPVDIRVFNKYKELFDSTARVDDEFNIKFRYDDTLSKSTYQLESNKVFDVYSHDVALQVLNLTIDSVGDIVRIPEDKNYVYEISRKVTSYKNRKYVLEDAQTYFNDEVTSRKNNEHVSFEYDYKINDLVKKSIYANANAIYQFESQARLRITLKIMNDSIIKISRIEKLPGSQIKCVNDSDLDGVLNNEEAKGCSNEYGDLTASGCPDKDLDGVPDAADGCPEIYGSSKNRGCPSEFFNNNFSLFGYTGGLFHSTDMTLPESGDYGYTEVDDSLSQQGKLKSSGIKFSAVFGFEFSYYFGKKAKHWGLSLGLSYSGFTSTDTIETPIITTFRSNDGQYDYRRRVTIKNGYEDLNYQVFNIPLLFKYRGKLGKKEVKKWSYEISAGPSFTYFNNSSDYNVTMDFEGIYQIDSNPSDPVVGPFFNYYDDFSATSTWNVWLTADSINNPSSSPVVNAVFDQLNANGYDFASNKNYTGTDNKATRWSIAMNINLDLSYKVNDIMDVKIGGQMLIAPALKSSSHYTPTNSTADAYNSIYRSNIKSLYMSYGIHVGIVIVLDKLDKKLGM